MKLPKLSSLELTIMETLWTKGPCSIREIHETLLPRKQISYSAVQTMVYRLEVKKACGEPKR
ncbi:MAG: BlaI/MecI/CopY family transcriptional regulator [Acidobacteriota bacterium]